MGRFLICVGKATDFGNVHRNWAKKKMKELSVTATSGGRAFRTSAFALFLRYASERLTAVLQSLTQEMPDK